MYNKGTQTGVLPKVTQTNVFMPKHSCFVVIYTMKNL